MYFDVKHIANLGSYRQIDFNILPNLIRYINTKVHSPPLGYGLNS